MRIINDGFAGIQVDALFSISSGERIIEKVNIESQSRFCFLLRCEAPNLALKLIATEYANMMSCGCGRITFVVKSNSVLDRRHASGARI